MRVTVHDDIADIGADHWNALAPAAYPFLQFEFLHATEASGCVAPDTGWSPCHLVLRDEDGSARAAMPLYEKSHSWGEFVFDWAWANAYDRAGFDYYPKLVSAVPFTPAQSPRLLLRDPQDAEAAGTLLQAALTLADERECSSLHVLFPGDDELPHLEAAGLKLRKDCQFHWQNQGYSNFDEFLETFSARKRKKARRDRRYVAEAGIRFRRMTGREMQSPDWELACELMSRTFMRRGSMPYFSLEFFQEIGRELSDHTLAIFADDDEETIAVAVFYIGDDALYGRYWGSRGHYNALHFETCYYQGIDYCIEHGIGRFEPGTQGEHKISRGFGAATTWSAHWLAQPEFFNAIGRYLDEESRHVDRYIQAVDDHSPYKQDELPE